MTLLTLPDGWAVLLDCVAWATTGTLTGWIAHRLPSRRLSEDGAWTRLRAFERDGRAYSRWLRVHRWKDLVPEAGAFFRGGFSKRRLSSRDPAHLARFVAETRRAELTHLGALAWTPLFALWNRPALLAAMVAYGLVANVPFIIIQRYNRARLLRALERSATCRGARLRPRAAPAEAA